MNRNILLFISLCLFEQIILIIPNRQFFFLPMKKNNKYGDDICYYRQEIDDKHDFAVYYVKPCEKGKYCEDVGDNEFGFCKDILTTPIDFPTYEGNCNSNGECLSDLDCDNGKCIYKCPNNNEYPFRYDFNHFDCVPSSFKKTDDGKHYKIYKPTFETSNSKSFNGYEETYGKYPGPPKEKGIIRYTSITDYYPITTADNYESYTRWIKESEDWCTIGEGEDGVFVTNKKFCKSGFTLKFYPKGDLIDPNIPRYNYNSENLQEMCVTPIQIDKNNPEVGGIIVTYKINDGNELKYNYKKYYHDDNLNENVVIKSQIYTQFIEEFNNSSDEDKKSCYKISLDSQVDMGNCQNIKLLKLYYFYFNINDYLFYKDRKDLEKVLHFKIQNDFHRYYEFSSYLNLNYLFLLLILILL